MMNKNLFIISLPNVITVIRILLTPLFVIFLQSGLHLYALFIFVVAAISDGLDGFLARYFDQRTVLGAYLDPLADKLLLITAFIGMAVLQLIPAWLAVIVISRDILILMGIGVFTISQTNFEIQPSLWSKMTTCTQLFTICLVLLSLMVSVPNSLKSIFFFLTAIITIISGGHYLFVGLNILHNKMDTDQQ
jgi:cardiolipin synthase